VPSGACTAAASKRPGVVARGQRDLCTLAWLAIDDQQTAHVRAVGDGRSAARLAAGAPLAVRYTKLAVNKLVKDALNVAFDASTALELVTFQSADHQGALVAIREKRPPRFHGR